MIRTRLAILGLECNEQGIILYCFKVKSVRRSPFYGYKFMSKLGYEEKTTNFTKVNNGPSGRGKQVVVLAMENTKQM